METVRSLAFPLTSPKIPHSPNQTNNHRDPGAVTVTNSIYSKIQPKDFRRLFLSIACLLIFFQFPNSSQSITILSAMAMARASSALLVAAIVAASCCLMVSGARSIQSSGKGSKFIVQGRVFCDTCKAGFETPATTYVAGAKVRVQCRTRTTGAKTCDFDGVTDETGTYKILVEDEHEHEICESVLVESPDNACKKIVQGRERAQVFLTRNNGIASDTRYANALGFEKDVPLAFCASLMKQYEEYGI